MPENVKKLFWDVQGVDDVVRYKNFIIERILEMGNIEETKWMEENFTRSEIEKVLEKSKKLSKKSANYWAKVYNYPFDKIECLKKPSQSRQNRFS